MKVNPSATPAASSQVKTKPAAQQARSQDFDALLNLPDDLTDADAQASDASAAAAMSPLGGYGAADVSADGRDAEQTRQPTDDPPPPLTAAEEAAQAAMLPGNRELRPEATSDVTPRRILHVVDMEKIVATVRTQTFSGNEAQATIQLSHSILDGLSIKLQTDARGRVSAEITATTEAAKRIVDAHARELNDLLRMRGLDVTSFSTKLAEGDAGTAAGDEGGASPQSSGGRRAFADFATEAVEPEPKASAADGEGIYTA
ncbi:MAG: flagellar hook-length control protein FliK [Chloracidobacterium sp.]|uniref:Flagellar hook-length control protein FliK n=1 Tax=Chloracidobacterium validum TaxID=2821543 RepID=A0ABX8BDB4_9BACT|nr:flagellar hook-length control protein FliK [Chloracidobacterium validum]QUW04412.1 flagellar hook-length control protein FliK [Chloracidobacterium validum]